MRIAQVSPLYESVPPKLYGGTERVVHYLTEELVAQGHDVTLFASGDSATKAKLISPCPKALRLNPNHTDPLVSHYNLMELVESRSNEFDIVHSHIDYLYFPLIRRSKVPHVTTLHGRLDLHELQPLYKNFHEIPLISISDAQRVPVSYANWIGTVYHGLSLTQFKFNPADGKYLTFVGRISPEKRVDNAIEIAKKTGIPLRIAAKVDKADKDYFDFKIKKLMDHPLIEFIGEIGEKEKEELFGNALCLLYPIDWPEPFGLAMIESMACGTPVIAFNRGSVPEVINEGVTGFIVNSNNEAVEAIKKIPQLDRKKCRETFERRFSAGRMANDYVKIYSDIIKKTRFNELDGKFTKAKNKI